MFWRIASDEKFSASLMEIKNDWTLRDLVEAHLVLDWYDTHEREQQRDLERQKRKLRRNG